MKNEEKFYPKANEWMWNYCTFLGKFTDSDGQKYDLGVHINEDGLTAAIVDGEEPGDYYSGDLDHTMRATIEGDIVLDKLSAEKYKETIIRANNAGLFDNCKPFVKVRVASYLELI